MQTTLMTCILQTVFDIRLIFCSNLYKNHQRYIWLRHKIIWNYFWSEFFLNLSLYSTNAKYIHEPTCNIQCCHMIWLSMILSEHCVLNTSIGIFLLSLIFVLPYWLSSLFFFLWFALYHFDERTVEYMYLFNS